MGKKATNAEVEQRVTAVTNLLIAGVSRAGILEYAGKQKWGIERSMIDEYISRATDIIKQSSIIDRDEQVGLAVRRLTDLYKTALAAKDTRTALAVQKEINQLLGLPEAAQINLNVDFGDMSDAMQEWKESIVNMGKPAADTAGADE